MIQHAPDAPDGEVLTLPAYACGDFPPTSAILCRNTAPLVAFAFALLTRDVACHIVGRDIAAGLDRLIEKMKATDITNLRCKLLGFQLKETTKLRKKGQQAQAENLDDKVFAILALTESAVAVAEVKARIQRIFANGDGLTLSTIHKSKGLEWDHVFLLDWHLLPARWATADWERRQERNLQYVAVTRAKSKITLINSNNWRP